MESILKQRTISAIIFAVVVIGLFSLGSVGSITLLTIVAIWTCYEFLAMLKSKPIKMWLGLFWAIAFLSTMVLIQLRYPVQKQIMCIALVFYLANAAMLFIPKVLLTSWIEKTGMIYPLLGPAIWIAFLVESPEAWVNLMLILFLIWASDSGAYLVGRKWGKTKLFERVSPKKTWEGLMGGLLLTLILGGIIEVCDIPGTESINWFLMAIVAVVFGTIGDLFQSKIKRENHIKDSGKILPGHGGIWDRFDSLLFLLPFAMALILLMK